VPIQDIVTWTFGGIEPYVSHCLCFNHTLW